jgi:hypothetical protein
MLDSGAAVLEAPDLKEQLGRRRAPVDSCNLTFFVSVHFNRTMARQRVEDLLPARQPQCIPLAQRADQDDVLPKTEIQHGQRNADRTAD